MAHQNSSQLDELLQFATTEMQLALINRQNKNVDRLQAKLDEMLRNLMEKSAEENCEMKKLKDENEELKTNMNMLESMFLQSVSRIPTTSTTALSSAETLAQLEFTLAKLEREFAEYRENFVWTSKAGFEIYDAKQREILQVVEEIEVLKNSMVNSCGMSKLKAENDELKAKMIFLERVFVQSEISRIDAEQKFKMLQEESANIETGLRREIRSQNHKILELEEYIEELEDMTLSDEKKCFDLIQENKRLEARIKHMDQINKDLNIENEELCKKRGEIWRKNEQLRIRRLELERIELKQNRKNAELKQNNKKLEKKLETMEEDKEREAKRKWKFAQREKSRMWKTQNQLASRNRELRDQLAEMMDCGEEEEESNASNELEEEPEPEASNEMEEKEESD